ncbi:TonB-dependent receptor [Oxalobacteraceae bacterium A2-2]
MAKYPGISPALIAAGISILAVCTPAARAQEAPASFHVAAGPAVKTIPEFARQAGLTVLATTEDLAGIATNEVRGSYAPAEALARLLAGTRLRSRIRDNGTVLFTLAPPDSEAEAGRALDHGEGSVLRFKPGTLFELDHSEEELEELISDLPKVVVSMRRSQRSAIGRKKHAATAMDSIVADDVGALPDRNVGEAISRVAGVAVNRGDFDEGSSVSIRGNGPELTRVELDGQAVRSAGGADMNGGGDGRATEFRQLSADLIKSVDVVKGSTADMTEGSLGGSIIIKTRSSLDFDQPYVSLRTAGTQNSLNKRWDPDLNLIMTRKFLDGRLGVLVNASALRLTNESHQFQVSSNGQDGYMRAIDFDNSPQKTFSYHPETVDLGDAASTRPWASYGGWDAATPLDIVTKSAAAQSKDDCAAAFPVLATGSAELKGLSATNKAYAIAARNQELASCLNQWNDTNPALLRYFVKRQVDDRKNIDLRTDFKVDDHLTMYAKGSYSRREVDDNFLTYSLGNVAVTNGVANIVPGSALVDANHRVTQYTLSNAGVFNDQIRNRMGTATRYLQLGGAYHDGPFSAEFMAGDSHSRFWRGDMRTSWGYAYGSATVSLQPNGIWAYALPSGVNLEDWGKVAALQSPTSTTAPQYTASSPQITYTPQLRETGERSSRLDLAYALPDTVPWFRRVKGGYNLRDSSSDAWGNGGYTVSPAVGTAGTAGYVPAVTVPGNNVRSSFVGCQDTAGSLAPGGTPCTYGLIPTANSRNYQIVLTPQQFLNAVMAAMSRPATATRLFDGASGRPDALIGNWTQIDVDQLFAGIGAPNLNFDCMKVCMGSDGKLYQQPRTSIRERTDAAYLMAEFGLDHIPLTNRALPFGWELEGNLGYRYVRTRVEGSGNMTFISKLKTAAFDAANPGAAAGYTLSQVTQNTTIRATTHDFLPIYNLALWLAPDQLVLRYSHARTVARPGASRLVPSGSCTYDETLVDTNGNPVGDMACSTMGNPALRAQSNTNQNLSVEWYPNRDSMFSASAYKQIGRIGPAIVDSIFGRKVFAGTEVVDPATGRTLADIPFDLKTYLNGPPATRTGVEFSAKTAFTFLPWKLRHTGFDANVTRQHSNQARVAWDLLSGEALPAVGEPKYSFNWALWYDDGDFSARVAVQTVGTKFNCIAPCGDTLSGYSLNAYPNASLGWKNPAYNPGPPNFTDRTSYVDGKIAWRINKNLDFFLEGRNLTNQTQTASLGSSAYADGTPSLQKYYYAGRRITIGLRFRSY